MTNYVQTTFFTPKDTLPVTDPNKTIFGAAYDVEFGNIATAIASKYDTTSTPTFAGAVTAPAFIPNGATVPINGMYLSAAHTVSFAANGVFEGSFNGGMVLGAPTGSFKGIGTLNATNLFINNVAVSTSVGANPTALVGLAAVNGVATTWMRSDGSPALDVTISPTWSGGHTFSNAITVNGGGSVFKGSVTFNAGPILIGGAGSGTGGNTRYTTDGGTSRWLTGILAGVGATAFSIYDLVRGVEVLDITTSGNITTAAPTSGNAFGISSLTGTAALFLNSTTGAASNLNIGWNIGLQSNQWNMYTQSTDPLVLGTIGAALFHIYTNSLERFLISSAGNITVNAPTSGVALAVTGNATSGAPISITGNDTVGILITGTDGTVTTQWQIAASATYWGTSSNHIANLITNNTIRIGIAAAGNVTINAPSSGVPLTINGTSGAGAYFSGTLTSNANSTADLNNLSTGTAAQVQLRLGNATHNLDLVLTSTGFTGAAFTGGPSGEVGGLITNATTVPLVLGTGSNAILVVNGQTSPTIQGFGPVANALVDMTPDKGTFTITYTGFTANPTGTAVWARNGNIITLMLPAGTGTSNATTMTATGLPAAIQPARAMTIVLGAALVEDNNFASVANCGASLAASSGTITFTYNPVNATWGGGGFTASGTKGISTSTPITYLLN